MGLQCCLLRVCAHLFTQRTCIYVSCRAPLPSSLYVNEQTPERITSECFYLFLLWIYWLIITYFPHLNGCLTSLTTHQLHFPRCWPEIRCLCKYLHITDEQRQYVCTFVPIHIHRRLVSKYYDVEYFIFNIFCFTK